MPALSGPRSVIVTSISVKSSPKRGSSDLSFRNSPTIPHIAFILICGQPTSMALSRITITDSRTQFNCDEYKFHHSAAEQKNQIQSELSGRQTVIADGNWRG